MTLIFFWITLRCKSLSKYRSSSFSSKFLLPVIGTSKTRLLLVMSFKNDSAGTSSDRGGCKIEKCLIRHAKSTRNGFRQNVPKHYTINQTVSFLRLGAHSPRCLTSTQALLAIPPLQLLDHIVVQSPAFRILRMMGLHNRLTLPFARQLNHPLQPCISLQN